MENPNNLKREKVSKSPSSILKMEHITKRFGELVANNDITFEVVEGEIRGLFGENGAGKTTLMNILYGLWHPDEGKMYIRGQSVKLRSPKEAIRHKIGMVSQHFSLVPTLSVTENIVLGDIPTNKFMYDKKLAEEKVSALADSLGFKIDCQAIVEDISVGEQQRVEIIKALYHSVEILILDEPTAVLTWQETEELFKVLRVMASQGKSIIFITHKLREVLLCDRITVLRAGGIVLEKDASHVDEESLCCAAFGEPTSIYSTEGTHITAEGQALLEVKNLEVMNDRGLVALKDVSFDILPGEILGVAGVAGNGQSELVEVITGLRKATEGKIILKGKDIVNRPPRVSREMGIGHIAEEKHRRGSLGEMSIAENLILGREDRLPFVYQLLMKYFPLLNYPSIKKFANDMTSNYEVKTRGINMQAKQLSGGNLQKLLLAREFAGKPRLIIAAQPTRGLDVKTIEFVHEELSKQRAEGKGVLLVSFDLDEILKLSDRIGIMFDGEMTVTHHGEIDRREIERMMLGAGGEVL